METVCALGEWTVSWGEKANKLTLAPFTCRDRPTLTSSVEHVSSPRTEPAHAPAGLCCLGVLDGTVLPTSRHIHVCPYHPRQSSPVPALLLPRNLHPPVMQASPLLISPSVCPPLPLQPILTNTLCPGLEFSLHFTLAETSFPLSTLLPTKPFQVKVASCPSPCLGACGRVPSCSLLVSWAHAFPTWPSWPNTPASVAAQPPPRAWGKGPALPFAPP